MNKKLLLLACGVLLALGIHTGHGRVVTLSVQGSLATNAVITIAAGEVATVIYYFDSYYEQLGDPSHTSSFLDVQRGSYKHQIRANAFLRSKAPTFAGPATITLWKWPGEQFDSMVTIEVAPESFPPDKTLIIPEGTGARVALESSTNLLQWTEQWSGSFTNAPSNRFFRLRAERFP